MAPLPKLLIIDDEEIVLDSCLQILAGGEYDIVTATDGTHGLKELAERRPDLAFVDLKMPGISGFEVIEQIHAIDPTIVTIVITGYATVSSAVEAMKKGAFDFLPKPFTPDELRLITRRGLEKRRLILETIALRREKEMLREHFAAIVSHELKSPLSSVQQNLFVFANELQGQLDPDQKHRLERLQSRIDDLMKLIHTWMRVISTDIQGIQEHFILTSVHQVISKAIEGVQPHADRKDIEIFTRMSDDLQNVYGDEGTLVEAIVNLLGNAIKYSGMGGVVRLDANNEADNVWITVADKGIGISEEDLPFVFDDFFAGEPAPGMERGSGLGLALTRRIIEAHGGDIMVESEFGRGSTFKIRLPALQNDRVSSSHVAQTA